VKNMERGGKSRGKFNESIIEKFIHYAYYREMQITRDMRLRYPLFSHSRCFIPVS
jgi:hypothetical protein